MSFSNDIGAYEDCLEIFDRALMSEKGVRVPVEGQSQAITLINRLHYARVLLRDQSRALLESQDPRWGRCEYDVLIVRRPRQLGDGWWVYVEQRNGNVEIEDLT